MNASEIGLKLIRDVEGLRLVAYQDDGGVWTIGYGHTGGVERGQAILLADAEKLLRRDVLKAEDTIRRNVSAAVLALLPQPAWDALVSFVFNLGGDAFRNPRTHSSTGILRALEAHQWPEVAVQMKRWVYDNHRKVGGLVRRRNQEAELWGQGKFA